MTASSTDDTRGRRTFRLSFMRSDHTRHTSHSATRAERRESIMSTRSIMTAVLAVAFMVAPASADWVPSDGHKMHYPQLPDLTPEGTLGDGPTLFG